MKCVPSFLMWLWSFHFFSAIPKTDCEISEIGNGCRLKIFVNEGGVWDSISYPNIKLTDFRGLLYNLYPIRSITWNQLILQTTTTAPCNGDAAGLNCTTIDETFNDNLCDPSNAATADLRFACCDYCANKPTPPTTTTGKAWQNSRVTSNKMQ